MLVISMFSWSMVFDLPLTWKKSAATNYQVYNLWVCCPELAMRKWGKYGKMSIHEQKNVYTLFSDRAIGMGEHQTICRNITPNHNLDIGTLSGYNVIHYSLKIYVVIRPFCRIPAQ